MLFGAAVALLGGGDYRDGLQVIDGKEVYCKHETVNKDVSWYSPWSHIAVQPIEDMTCKELEK